MAEFRELPGLPAYGPMPLQFSSTGQGMHREGFVIEFLPETEERWVGNFQPGLTGYRAAVAHPNGKSVVVISGSEAYVVDPRARTVEETFGGQIGFVAFVPEIEALVFFGLTSSGLRVAALPPAASRGTGWRKSKSTAVACADRRTIRSPSHQFLLRWTCLMQLIPAGRIHANSPHNKPMHATCETHARDGRRWIAGSRNGTGIC
jgi:hypothetical protein